MTDGTGTDWLRGDSLGLDIPAHAESLRSGGTAFLTAAFRATGAIGGDNRVSAITEFREIPGGSTGRKLLLSVDYERDSPDLHRALFVKFSRDFDDARRDAAKVQMEREAQFALLSRSPGFPIAVPTCYFSDFHHPSGTGIIISQRIFFATGGVEPHYPKCRDHLMPDPLGHYGAIVSALARLAGNYSGGRDADLLHSRFPFEPGALSVSRRTAYTPAEIGERVNRYAGFARDFPQLLPDNIRAADFLSRLTAQAPRFQSLAASARELLCSRPEMIALCHWNAHVDNAWFWRSGSGELECGLMDWGNVSQMNVAMALWGCLSAAEPAIWNDHLDELLALFTREFHLAGGPALDREELQLHLTVYACSMGLAWMLDAPRLLLAAVPDLARAQDRCDPLIQDSEFARSQLLIMTVFLNLWDNSDMQGVLARLEALA